MDVEKHSKEKNQHVASACNERGHGTVQKIKESVAKVLG